MTTSKSIAAILTLALAAGAGNAQAQTDQDHSAHHPGATQTAPQPSGATPMGGQTGGMMDMGGQATPGGRGMQGMMDGNMQAMMMQMMRERMAHERLDGSMGMMRFDHIEGRIAFLKAEIGITEAQQQQWTAFADALRAQAGKTQGRHGRMMQGGLPAAWPDRLVLEAQALSARLDAVKAIEGPAQALYAALSPDQQKKANELLSHPMEGM